MRAEMGYPIIVTPVSQFIASQAAHNVIDGERWRSVSDETVRYFLGHYGEPPAPVDPEIADRVLARPQAAKLGELQPLSLEGARERFGRRISEEELLLRLTMPAEQVDAMIAARDGGDGAAAPASRRAPRSLADRHAAARAPAARVDHQRRDRLRRGPGGVAPCLTSPGCAGSCSTSTGRCCTAGPMAGGALSRGRSRSSQRIRDTGRRLALFTNGSHVPSARIADGLRDDGLESPTTS